MWIVLENVQYHIKLPFTNLTKNARVLQLLRFFTSMTTVSLIMAMLIGSLTSSNIYVVRLDFTHLDVSAGLYKALRSSVSTQESAMVAGYDMAQSLTASQIDLLSQYATQEVGSAPQFITSGFFGWCYGNYNLTQVSHKGGNAHYVKLDTVIDCTPPSSHYSFDYRQQLTDIGLASILTYAYESNYMDDAYERQVADRRNMMRLAPPAMIFCGIVQLLILTAFFILYSNRGTAKDLSQSPRFLIHILSVFSLASFMSMAIAAGIVTGVEVSTRTQISQQLSDFGIYLHFGSVWFSLMWITVASSFLNACSWAGAFWCANPDTTPEDSYDNKIQLRHLNRYNSMKRYQDVINEDEGRSRQRSDSITTSLDTIENSRDTDPGNNKRVQQDDYMDHVFREQSYNGYSERPLSFLTDEEAILLTQNEYSDKRSLTLH